MAKTKRGGRTRFAVLGVLSGGAATGYEVKKLLQETTAHFWKESYGQIYPTLEELLSEKLVAVDARERTGRERKRYRILPSGEHELRSWIRHSVAELRPGRNELLLKLFFARKSDVDALLPQVEQYALRVRSMYKTFRGFRDESESEELGADRQGLIGTTIDFGVAAAQMQLDWCDRTMATLAELAIGSVEGAQ
jgi:DNA-binding PadR family transcriptional regulator